MAQTVFGVNKFNAGCWNVHKAVSGEVMPFPVASGANDRIHTAFAFLLLED